MTLIQHPDRRNVWVRTLRCRLCGDPITAPLYRKVPVHRKCWEMEKSYE